MTAILSNTTKAAATFPTLATEVKTTALARKPQLTAIWVRDENNRLYCKWVTK